MLKVLGIIGKYFFVFITGLWSLIVINILRNKEQNYIDIFNLILVVIIVVISINYSQYIFAILLGITAIGTWFKD